MPVFESFAALGRLIMRTPPPPADELEAYAHDVIPMVDRAELLYQYWLEQSSLFSDSERLGNVAAIHRWETAKMSRSLEAVKPPAVLASAHANVVESLDMASRAAQLLSSGSRFHNAGAVCEGQALLGDSRERRLAALKSMRRYLAPIFATAAAENDIALTEAGALAAPAAEHGQVAAPASGGPPSGAATAAAADDYAEVDPAVAPPAPTPAPAPAPVPADHQEAAQERLPALPDAAEQLAADGAEVGTATGTASSPARAATRPAPPDPSARPGWGALFDDPGEPPGR
jgi:hypothetical protein